MSRKLEKSPHDVWLAGLGALAVTEQEGSNLFQALVKKGAEVELRIASASSRSKWSLRSNLSRGSSAGKVVFVVEVGEAGKLTGRSAAKRKKRSDLPGPADEVVRHQNLRNELARKEFLQEFGSPVSDAQKNLKRWQREGRIFAVTDHETSHVPSFQFDDKGHPRPAVARVIQLLGGTTSDWGLALWFAANNGWLGGKRPADLLASDPERVLEAAEREAEELVF